MEKPATTPDIDLTACAPHGNVPFYLADAVITNSPGLVIPSSFVGLSHEWGVQKVLTGSAATGKNMQYRQLLRNLLQYMGGPMVIRIGGNSTDRTTTIDAPTLASLNDLVADMNDQVVYTLGINMGSNDPAIATAEIEAIASAIPASSLLGLELGNEPDGFANGGLRPAGYNFSDYLPQMIAWTQLVAASAPQVNVIAPALSGFTKWVTDFEAILTTPDAPQLVTQHYYVGCFNPAAPEPLDFLLPDHSACAGPRQLTPYIATVHSSGKKIRIGEMNSLADGGQPGVSDAFASALWGIDIMFEFAAAGADGVNWHTGNGGGYALFQFSITPNAEGINQYAITEVRPLFYGLQLFAEATTASGSLLPVTLTTPANLKVWAVKGQDGLVRVVVINKDEAMRGVVTLTIPGYSTGTVSVLAAPSFSAGTGVTLAGQTYDGSPDGTMQGQLSTQPIHGLNNQFLLNLPTVSAALVTLSQ